MQQLQVITCEHTCERCARARAQLSRTCVAVAYVLASVGARACACMHWRASVPAVENSTTCALPACACACLCVCAECASARAREPAMHVHTCVHIRACASVLHAYCRYRTPRAPTRRRHECVCRWCCACACACVFMRARVRVRVIRKLRSYYWLLLAIIGSQ